MVFGDLEDKVAKYKVCSPVTELGHLLMILVSYFIRLNSKHSARLSPTEKKSKRIVMKMMKRKMTRTTPKVKTRTAPRHSYMLYRRKRRHY